MRVPASEVRVGDRCLQRVGRREWAHTVTRVAEQPVGVITITFSPDFRWTLPAQQGVEIECD